MKLAISISGGGALGIGPLHFMRRLEDELGFHLADAGSAFAGTSTGSIVAAGLCTGMTATQLYDLYRNNLPSIFTRIRFPRIVSLFSSDFHLYKNSNLKHLLQQNFAGTMDKFKKPIYIPSTFMNGQRVEKVWDRGDNTTDQWFAILSSCSAPTYFDPISRDKDGVTETYCDGGLWANDPIMVLESGLKTIPEFNGDYKILSFNTGMRHPNEGFEHNSIVGWGKYIINEWVARTGSAGLYEAQANLGLENVQRLAPMIEKPFAMDDLSILDEVCDIWDKYYESDSIGEKTCEFIKTTINA